MDRNLPGVRFIDSFDEEPIQTSGENGVAFGNSPAPTISTAPIAPMPASVFQSSVVHTTPITGPIITVATPRAEVTEPQQFLRQPLTSILPDTPVNRRIKTEDGTSTEPPMSAATSTAGQSLVDFLEKVDNYKPTIPESIVQYYMQTAGLSTSDPRVTQLIALASQKFISDIVNDAFHFSQTQKVKKSNEKKNTLTMDVLKPVLGEYGMDVKKPAYMQ